MASAIDWDVARRVANRVGGREPFSESYHSASLASDCDEFTAIAEELVAQTTGLRSRAGPARARVADRSMWVDANVASFQRLMRPLFEKLGPKTSSGALAPVTRRVSGAELGLMLGWMSTRVLGQYDLLVIEDERPEDQDIVYYVGSNVLAIEKRYAFAPREFRLWLALHEVTHRAQFTGVPWMRGHFTGLIDQSLTFANPDLGALTDAMRSALRNRRDARDRVSQRHDHPAERRAAGRRLA